MDSTVWVPLPGSFEAFTARVRSIMRELADRQETRAASVSGFALVADFLAGRAFAPGPVAIEAAIRRASGGR